MGKKNRSGNREPRKPKQPKASPNTAENLGELIKSRASVPGGAR